MKYALIIILIAVVVGYFVYSWLNTPGQYNDFVQCLTDSGAVLYGTDWCGVCKQQKALFGGSFDYVNYVNCDASVDACNSAGVEAYPTWIINDTNYPGLQSLEKLASLTSCQL